MFDDIVEWGFTLFVHKLPLTYKIFESLIRVINPLLR